MKTTTLCELFESGKATLQQNLEGMSLPNDLLKVQDSVASYLAEVFDSEGEFRQNLTQSEDYILEAAISLLNAQQKISAALTKEVGNESAPKQLRPSTTAQEDAPSPRCIKADSNYTLVGTAAGSIAGKLLFGGWGAVFGAIAGVAVSVYLSNKTQVQAKPKPQSAPRALVEDNLNKPIDVDCFLGIIRDVCESVDNLIGTVRVQMQRVKSAYENTDKPSLLGNYSSLMNNLKTLFEVADSDAEDKCEEILMQIEMVKRSLKNYGIIYINGKFVKD